MRYAVSPNTGITSRVASLTIAGNVFTVTEAGLSSYVITASAGAGGSISPSGGISVQSGANQTFTITPNTGYRIAGVTVDGVSKGSIASFTFTSLNANHTITASFTPISSAPTLTNTPIVATNSAANVTLSSATLNGTVNPNGLPTTYIFQWGPTTSYGNATAAKSAGSGANNVSATANLIGLAANRTYHYRLVATNSVGTTYGTDGTFSTRITSNADFNNDGKTDILWRNKQSGQITVWYMNGATMTSNAVVANYPDLDWEIAGTGDFNSDGKTDILWRHAKTGQIAVWYMNGVTPTSSAVVADYPDLDWKIAGTGDFNNDGKTDILWRHAKTGQIAVWYMNGITPTGTAVVADFPDLSWGIVGTGDFNGDGKTDLLWRNKVSGTIIVWYMNGATMASYAVVAEYPDLDWEIAGAGDFNGDGKTDLLWRNKQSGTIIVWYMNGATMASYALVANFPSLDWVIAAP